MVYCEVLMTRQDCHKTCFVYHNGMFQYTQILFTLEIDISLRLKYFCAGYRLKTFLVYMTDLIIFPKSVKHRIRHADEICTTLIEAGVLSKINRILFIMSRTMSNTSDMTVINLDWNWTNHKVLFESKQNNVNEK